MGKVIETARARHNDAPPATPTIAGEIRTALTGLRERYGPQPWLTVASGVVAEGVRLARMSGREMFDLLRSEEVCRNGLALYKNLPGNRRLRAAFENHCGGIDENGGVLGLNLTFDGKRNNIVSCDDGGVADYCERLYSLDEGRQYDGQRLTVANPDLPCPDIASLIGRPVAEAFPLAPRCLRSGSTRIVDMVYRPAQRHRNRLDATVSTHWESLTLMPPEVSVELGIEPQVTTDRLPWLPIPTAAREAMVPRARRAAGGRGSGGIVAA